jgi:hypothetical protein
MRFAETLLGGLAVAVVACAGGPALAQPPFGPPPAQSGPGYPKVYDPSMPFEPKDLGGIWTPNVVGLGGGGRCRDCGDRGFSLEFPMFTPAGQAAFDKNIPSYGRLLGSDDAKAHPEAHIGRRRSATTCIRSATRWAFRARSCIRIPRNSSC